MPQRLKLTLLYGGPSGEHEISLRSAASVLKNLDPSRYQIDLIGIDTVHQSLLSDMTALSKALGYPMHYAHPSEIMAEIARLTPGFRNVSYDFLDKVGSVQWPCNDAAPDGSPIMHIKGFARGKGKMELTEYVPTDERTGPRFPLILTTGRILSQYNVGAQTRRTPNVAWHAEDVLEIHPHDAGGNADEMADDRQQAGNEDSHRSEFRRPALGLLHLFRRDHEIPAVTHYERAPGPA